MWGESSLTKERVLHALMIKPTGAQSPIWCSFDVHLMFICPLQSQLPDFLHIFVQESTNGLIRYNCTDYWRIELLSNTSTSKKTHLSFEDSGFVFHQCRGHDRSWRRCVCCDMSMHHLPPCFAPHKDVAMYSHVLAQYRDLCMFTAKRKILEHLKYFKTSTRIIRINWIQKYRYSLSWTAMSARPSNGVSSPLKRSKTLGFWNDKGSREYHWNITFKIILKEKRLKDQWIMINISKSHTHTHTHTYIIIYI